MMIYDCKVENKSQILRELTISVKPESIQHYIKKQYAALQKKARIDGFRKGKVPMPILKKNFNGDVKSDVITKIIEDSVFQALQDNKIQAIGSPSIQAKSGFTLDSGEALTFVAIVEVLPDFKVGDISKIKVTKPSTEVTEEEFKKAIDDFSKTHAEITPDETNEGPLKDADLIELSFTGTIDGKDDNGLKAQKHLLKVGAGNYLDGFEKNIVGMKKGETRKFTMTFPKDYNAQYADKTAEFEVTVHGFKKEIIPDLNDEFQAKFRDDMKKGAARRAYATLKERLIEELIAENKFDVPSHFISKQFEHLLKDNATSLLKQGFTEKMVKEYLDINKEEFKVRAEKQVKATLILDKIFEAESFKVEEADMDREYAKMAETEKVSIQEIRKFFEDDASRRELKFRLKEERTFDFILEKVKITTEKV